MKKIKHYKILELLGSGGMGKVYKAFDSVLEREVAIKVMHKHLSNEGKDERFVQEARAAASLVHHNIVTIHEIGKARCGYYIVMEYVRGAALTQYLSGESTISTNQAINLTIQTLSGLAQAHSSKMLHRDIKPDNILVTESNTAKILDFGIAKITSKDTLTVAGNILGTVEYMAPEQMLGEQLDASCDIYSVGVMLYHILTKRLPFEGENPISTLYKKLHEDPPPPSYFNKEICEELDLAVLKAIRAEREHRWNSAVLFSEALYAIINRDDHQQQRNNDIHLAEFYIGVEDTISDESDRLGSTFIGREQEFRKVVQLFDKSTKGVGQTVILKGEAGVGKSTLANKLVQYAELNQAWIVYGTCLYQEGLNPYMPYMDALRGFFSKTIPNMSVEERELLKTMIQNEVPLLQGLTNLSIPSSDSTTNAEVDENSEKDLLFKALSQVIIFLTAYRPTVFIVDDLHLADEASLQLFHYLGHHVSDIQLLLLGITRTERYDLHNKGKPTMTVEMLTRIGRESNCELITLLRFDKQHCGSLVDKSLSPALFTEEFYEYIYRETKGNPLFITETLKLLRDNNVIYRENGVWYNKRETLKHDAVPQKVEDVFIQRLSALTEEEYSILQFAAVIGQKFEVSQLSRLLKITKIKLLRILKRVEMELQVIKSTEVDFHFEHPILCEILYNELTPALKREYHLMIAQDLETINVGDIYTRLGELAQHFRKAGEHRKAMPLLYQVAQQSFELALYTEASLYIKDYLKSVEHTDPKKSESVIHLDLYNKLGKCYEQTGQWSESLEAYNLLLKLGESRQERSAQIEALGSLGRVQLKQGNFEKAINTYNHCLQAAERYGINNVAGRVYNSLGVIHRQQGCLEEAEKYYEQAIRAKENEGDEYGKANSLMNIGVVANMRSNFDLALNSYQRALEVYTSHDDKARQAQVYNNIGLTYADTGEYAHSLEAFKRSLDLSDEVHDQALRGLIYLNMSKTQVHLSNLSEAKKLATKALKMFKLMGNTANVAEAYHIFGLLNGEKGNYSEAELFLNESIRLNKQEKNLDGLIEAYESYGNLCRKKGSIHSAKQYFEKALNACRELNLHIKAEDFLMAINELIEITAEDDNKTYVIDDGVDTQILKASEAGTQ